MKRLYISLVLAAVCGLPLTGFAQSSVSDPARSGTVPSTPATLKPGDAVEITVWRKPELSGEFFVANDGSIAHPFYQEVRIGGLSVEVATQRVQSFLEQYETSPRVRLDPLYRVSVGGEVRSPRIYNLRPEHTISDAVQEAGGPTDRGRHGRLRLYRNGEVHKLSLGGLEPTALQVRVQSGDRIIIESNLNVFRDIVRPTLSTAGSLASLYYFWDRRIRRR